MIEIYGQEPQLPLKDKMLRLARDISLLELGTGAEKASLKQEVNWQPNVPSMFSQPIRLRSVVFDGLVDDTAPIMQAKFCIDGPNGLDIVVTKDTELQDDDPFAVDIYDAFSGYYHHAHSLCLAAADRLNLRRLGLENRLPVPVPDTRV